MKTPRETDILAEAKRLRRAEPERFKSWAPLARQLGVGVRWLRYRLEPGFADKNRAWSADCYHLNANGVTASSFLDASNGARPKPDVKGLKRVPLEETRDLTGQILGDPKPGFSALDRKRRKTLAQEAKEFQEARK